MKPFDQWMQLKNTINRYNRKEIIDKIDKIDAEVDAAQGTEPFWWVEMMEFRRMFAQY